MQTKLEDVRRFLKQKFTEISRKETNFVVYKIREGSLRLHAKTS